MRIYETGTIILDIIDPAKKSAVWRATASGEIDREKSQEKRLELIGKVIDDALKKFRPSDIGACGLLCAAVHASGRGPG